MKAKLKFLRNFFNPITSKVEKEETLIEIEVDDLGQPKELFWREQLKFNDISKAFELNIEEKKIENIKNKK